MIQRIQTLYYSLTAICLIIVSFGATIFAFDTKSDYYIYSSYGLQHFNGSHNLVDIKPGWLYLSTIALTLMCVMLILSYKNLARQFKLGRLILLVYLIILIVVVASSFFGDKITGAQIISSKMGAGFFIFVAGFPFVFLGNLGVKRDKKLLDSLNRLR